jgi:hypothetical protein
MHLYIVLDRERLLGPTRQYALLLYERWKRTETEPASGTLSSGVLCRSSYPDLTLLLDVDSLAH